MNTTPKSKSKAKVTSAATAKVDAAVAKSTTHFLSRVWLVSVAGMSSSRKLIQASYVVTLPHLQTPVDWVLSHPNLYYTASFVPSHLVGFWPVRQEQVIANLSKGPIVQPLEKYSASLELAPPPENDDDEEEEDDRNYDEY